ncbi:alpha/beta fold hydrolase [Sphingomonas colocasiae]|uniref:Alpha/beta hydrolase n=1 Tax=Sphingomonas colocasiae TaxID=1848973 RepID=A0ABS7PV89_9SPHN|nr:alpha/beta hydrolase [Sphingomonas colocasiae]MBY8825278.1 alpha/beta hydrolase [Sphingomonas colocasiae]
MRFWGFAIISGLMAIAAQAQPAPPATPDPLLTPYVKPGILARLPDGRRIHLKCMGSGSPTVIMTAGLGDWAQTWRNIQPAIVKDSRVRACAWDRAGFGFSDGSTIEQGVDTTTSDLEAALKSAGIKGPYILVGHSMGGYETLLFKDRHPQEVIGMVLVDPSIPHQEARQKKAAPALPAFADEIYAGMRKKARDCAAAVASGKLTPTSPDPDNCLAYPPTYPRALSQALKTRDMSQARWAATISLTANFSRSTELVANPARDYGAMPLIVLSAEKMQQLPPGTPQAVFDQIPAFQLDLAQAHRELAALSLRGENRRVADSAHYIQDERPDLVIAAIKDVIAAARKTAR